MAAVFQTLLSSASETVFYPYFLVKKQDEAWIMCLALMYRSKTWGLPLRARYVDL